MAQIQSRTIRGFAIALSLASGLLAQTGTITSTSMANYGPIVAPDSIAALWGTGLTAQTVAATSVPLPTTLGGVQVSIVDSKGAKFTAALFMVSGTQINFAMPAGIALGKAAVTVTAGNNTFQGTLLVSNVAPGIFTANANGTGVPAAQVDDINPAGQSTLEIPYMMGQSGYVATPVSLKNSGDNYFLILYGSGVRHHSLNPPEALVNGVKVPVSYAGAQSQFPGLDQINIGPLPSSLAGKGLVNVNLLVDGVPANIVQLSF